jgi:cellulose synthase/poly-beta-1,6-N-acetylglucosamine synthase-like glycosyltransferase
MAKPFVSVLIDMYNHERFIEKAIVSMPQQDFPADDRDILVVDDGSTDRTTEILRKFGSQIRILRKPNGGQASAFNRLVAQGKPRRMDATRPLRVLNPTDHSTSTTPPKHSTAEIHCWLVTTIKLEEKCAAGSKNPKHFLNISNREFFGREML